jgi:hypothetical protein
MVTGTDGFLLRGPPSRAGKSIKDKCGIRGRASAMARDGEQPIRRLSNVRHNICRIVNRCGSILFPRFELFDECGEMRGNGSREGVILVFEALPNC